MNYNLFGSGDLAEFPKLDYEYVTTTEKALKCLEEIEKRPIIEFDTEATGLDPWLDRVVLMQFGIGDRRFIFDVRDGCVDPQIFKEVLSSDDNLTLIQNAVFDYKMMKANFNIEVSNMYDTMLADELIFAGLNKKSNLAYLVSKYFNLNFPKDVATSFKDYDQEYQEYQLRYASNDVSILKDIYNLQIGELHKQGLDRVAKLEFDFVVPLSDMELNGITLDTDMWKKIIEETEDNKRSTKVVIDNVLKNTVDQHALFGLSLVNLDSPVQLKTSLSLLGIQVDNTAVEELQKYRTHDIIDHILNYREYEKFLTTYGENMMAKIHPLTHRLHTSFKQLVSTGRMSSSHPNLQNIPNGQKYRSCFVAREGYRLITSDMSQAELRIIAEYSLDPVFLEVFRTGQDLHTRTASDVFGVSIEEVIRDKKLLETDSKKIGYRSKVKPINFGLCIQEDMQLITNNGIKYIKKINTIKDFTAHDIGVDKIIDKKYMGKKEVFEIKTKFGYVLEATNAHIIKVIDEHGEYIDKKLCDIDVNKDYVCIKAGSNVFPKELYKFSKFEVIKRTNYIHFDLPTYLTEEWASFLGLFVSEGSTTKSRGQDHYSFLQFGFSDKDTEFISKIDFLLYSLFGDRLTRLHNYKKGVIRYSVYSVIIAGWIADICNVVNKDKTKSICVPDCIKQSPKNIQAMFLKWLFEGDGSAKVNGKGYSVTYSSKSEQLVKDLQIMLLNFGVLVSIIPETRKEYPGELYYVLRIVSNKSREIFLSTIGFLTKHKNNKCINTAKYSQSVYHVPYQHDRLDRLIKIKDIYDVVYNCTNNSKEISIGDINLPLLSEYDDFLNFIRTNNIVPLSIEGIVSKGVKPVWDISVDKHQYFLANGFITHNCYGLTRFGLARRLRISEKEAQKLIDIYFSKYRKVKAFLDKSGRDAVYNRYSTSISGRRRNYALPAPSDPDFSKIKGAIERAGKNHRIQGSNADTIKQAMVYLTERLKPYDAKLVLTVHDEVSVECHEDHVEPVAEITSQALIDGFGEFFNIVKMEADSLVGDCWLKG